MAFSKESRRLKIRKRIRGAVSGTAERPRLSVYRSNKEIYAQIVDDVEGKTIVAASSRDKAIADASGTKIEIANLVGKAIAEKPQKSSGETQTSNSLQQKFMGFIKNFLRLKKNPKLSNSRVSRCPFAAFIQ